MDTIITGADHQWPYAWDRRLGTACHELHQQKADTSDRVNKWLQTRPIKLIAKVTDIDI